MIPGIDLTLDRLPEQLVTLLLDPSSNVPAALVLYGIIAMLVIMLIVMIIFFLAGAEDDEEYVETETGELVAVDPQPAKDARERVTDPVMRRLTLLIAVAAVLLVWIAAGYTTSNSAVCRSCHVDTPHDKVAASENVHRNSACVSCHEPGGAFSRYVSRAPSRLAHMVRYMSSGGTRDSYGAVTQAACLTCHRAGIAKTTTDARTGVRMSHAEPLKASASCLDCHGMRNGVVGPHVSGMKTCLRCHDSRIASSDCSTCHDKRASAAARARTASFASVQIPEVKCGACHDEKKECDSCHGMRMPHSGRFMAYAHARAAAVNFWFNGGRTCAKCHTATRNPCQKCHTGAIGHAHPATNIESHKTSAESACNTCHGQWGLARTRDFCKDVCHSPEAIAESPR